MNNEYIICNKTIIEERITDLEAIRNSLINCGGYNEGVLDGKIKDLKQILSLSTPLMPEIDKAYEAGMLDKELSLSFDNPKGRYLSSLKLDI